MRRAHRLSPPRFEDFEVAFVQLGHGALQTDRLERFSINEAMGAPSRAAGLLDVEILAFPEHLVGVYGLRRARGHYARAHDGRVAVTQRRAVVAFEMRDGRQVARLLDMVVRKPD